MAESSQVTHVIRGTTSRVSKTKTVIKLHQKNTSNGLHLAPALALDFASSSSSSLHPLLQQRRPCMRRCHTHAHHIVPARNYQVDTAGKPVREPHKSASTSFQASQQSKRWGRVAAWSCSNLFSVARNCPKLDAYLMSSAISGPAPVSKSAEVL